VFELWGLADSVAKKCAQVFEQCPVPEKDGYIKVDPSIHSLIASLLAEAANVKKLLAVPTKPSFKETNDQFSFRVERTKLLNEALKSPSVVELSNVEARNSVEHFDQYLDRASLSFSVPGRSEPGFALYNMVLSSWKVFDKKAFPLKVYVANERKYFNLEWVADLSALHAECSNLIARIRSIPSFGKHEGPGGLMVPVK
jgi:hypothetical protein